MSDVTDAFLSMQKNFLSLTSDDKTSLGGTKSGFTSKSVFGSALVRLVTIFRSNIFDVKFSRRQNQIFAICRV